MKVLGEMWDKWLTQVSDWKEAEKNAEELLEIMDFTNIQNLSQHDAIFPFDYLATQIIRKCAGDCLRCNSCESIEGENYLVDVTIRVRKPVKKKRLATWRTLGFRTALLAILPKDEVVFLLEIEPSDQWINITPKMIKALKKKYEDFWFIAPKLAFGKLV